MQYLYGMVAPHSPLLSLVPLQSGMEWPGDSPEDQAPVAALPPRMSSEMDSEQFLKNTKEKLSPNANRSVRVDKGQSPFEFYLSALHLLIPAGSKFIPYVQYISGG